MKITDIKIKKLFDDENCIKATASVTFDHQLAVHDIKIIESQEELFVVMPARKNPDGTYLDIAHPINAEFRVSLENGIIETYKRELAEPAAQEY